MSRDQVRANPEQSKSYGPLPPEPTDEEVAEKSKEDSGKVKGHWNKRLNSFEKLIFIKYFREEKVCVMSSMCQIC